MSDISLVSAKAESVLECSLCETRISYCNQCGVKFRTDDQILHAVYDTMSYHFCSERCHQAFLNFEDTKMVVPA